MFVLSNSVEVLGKKVTETEVWGSGLQCGPR